MRTKSTATILVSLTLLVTVAMLRTANQAKASNLSGTLLSKIDMTVIPKNGVASVPGPKSDSVGQLDPGAHQLDPGERGYVLEAFSIDTATLQVLVTNTASGAYLAGKEYWSTNQSMLGAIARATSGTGMTISGVSHNWPAPTGFTSNFRMQGPVTWGTASAPSGLSWVYRDTSTNTYVCIEFNITGSAGTYSVGAIRWYLAARTAPRSGTNVFPAGTTYPLSYGTAPALPTGYSWYGVTVNPGS